MIFFYFLKIIFDISTSKQFKTYKSYSILVKKKFKIFKNAAATAFLNIVQHRCVPDVHELDVLELSQTHVWLRVQKCFLNMINKC